MVVEKLWRQVLGKSVVEKCWRHCREVLKKSVGEKCWRDVFKRSVGKSVVERCRENCCGEVSERSVWKEFLRRLL